MGCPKLTYHDNLPTLKVAYSSVLEDSAPCTSLFSFTRKSSAGVYRYGFNGMEKDDEVKGNSNSYDFGARMYDNRLGRWLSLDAYAVDYPSLSDYSFVANSPLMYVDPDGNKIRPTNINSKNLIDKAYDRIFSGELESIRGSISEDKNGAFSYNGSALTYKEAKNIIIDSELTTSKKLVALTYLKAVETKRTYEVQVEYNSGNKDDKTIRDENYGVLTPNYENASLSDQVKDAEKWNCPTKEIKREMTGSIEGEASSELFENQALKGDSKTLGIFNFQENEAGDQNQTNKAMDNMINQISGTVSFKTTEDKGGKKVVDIKHKLTKSGKESSKEVEGSERKK
jgi:RHS repeat-associated protein